MLLNLINIIRAFRIESNKLHIKMKKFFKNIIKIIINFIFFNSFEGFMKDYATKIKMFLKILLNLSFF